MVGAAAVTAPPQRLPGCNTLIALAFVAQAILIPVILLIHRTNPLARLGCGLPACLCGRKSGEPETDRQQPATATAAKRFEVRKNG
jgi:hypothetical protein